MAKAKKEEEVSFADLLSNLLRQQTVKKNQDQARAHAMAGGYNRDILKLREMAQARAAEQEAITRLVMDQVQATGGMPQGMNQSQDQLEGGTALDTLQGSRGGQMSPQAPGAAPRAPGTGMQMNPTVTGEPVGRAPIDTTAEPVRGLKGPNQAVGPANPPQSNIPTQGSPQPTNAAGRPNPVVQASPKPSMLMNLLRRAGPAGAAAGVMAPTEVAPGTYQPNEEAFRHLTVPDEEPVTMPPITVTAPRGPVEKTKGKGVSPVLPERKPPVPGSEAPTESAPQMRYVQMTVPVPATANEEQVAGFAKYIGAQDWGFRDDYVGEMAGHPAEKR